MPERTLSPWGWNRAARTLLVLIGGILSLGLIGLVGERPDGPIEFRPISVDPNTVPTPVLEALPGIGPARAAAIVAAREVEPFRSMGDVDRRVKGIGPVTAAALKPFFRFDAVPSIHP